tara:strand:+ start:541 stop:1329 length:789 start_codon:yes stop_codon:yes gene_type:complete
MGILDKAQDKISDITGEAASLAFGDGTIDGLRGVIGKHGGMAQNNRFNVILTPPKTALLNINKDDIIDNLLSGSFDVKTLLSDPRDISFLCSRAALPSWNISTFEYQSNKMTNKLPYTYIHEDLTISFLCTNDYFIKKMMDQWMLNVANPDGQTVGYKSTYTTDIVVMSINKKNIPIYSYKFENAYPLIQTAIEFEQGGTEFINFDVTFAYDRFIPEGTVGGSADGISNGFGKLNIPGGGNLASKAGSYATEAKDYFSGFGK